MNSTLFKKLVIALFVLQFVLMIAQFILYDYEEAQEFTRLNMAIYASKMLVAMVAYVQSKGTTLDRLYTGALYGHVSSIIFTTINAMYFMFQTALIEETTNTITHQYGILTLSLLISLLLIKLTVRSSKK